MRVGLYISFMWATASVCSFLTSTDYRLVSRMLYQLNIGGQPGVCMAAVAKAYAGMLLSNLHWSH